MLRYIRASLFVSALLLLVGCSTHSSSSFVKPEVAVTNMRVEGVSLFQTITVFDVRIDNENNFPLEIDGGVHRLYLNGEYIGKGMDKEGFSVARLDSVNRSIEVFISNVSLLTKLQTLFQKPELTYKIESTLYKKGSNQRLSSEDSGVFRLAPIAASAGAGNRVRRYVPFQPAS